MRDAVSYPERIVPDETEPGIVALHRRRYEFAEPWCEGKVVLDVACGVGYGTAHVAAVAAGVVGVDASEEAIAYARRRYPAANVEFAVMDAATLAFESGSFDVVCAFEAIEHLHNAEKVLREIACVLRPTGTFLASTPRLERTVLQPENPWHQVEYSPEDFEHLLRMRFEDVELYGQRRLQTRRHRFLKRVDVLGLRKRLVFLRPTSRLLGTASTADVSAAGIVVARGELDRATAELVAVCTRPQR